MTPGKAMKIRHRLKMVSKGPLPSAAAIALASIAIASMFPTTTAESAPMERPASVELKYMGDTLASDAELAEPATTKVLPESAATSYAEAYGFCAGFYHDDRPAMIDCQWAASEAFQDSTNPIAGISNV